MRGEFGDQILEKPEQDCILTDLHQQGTEVLGREWGIGLLVGEDRASIPECNLLHRQRANRSVVGKVRTARTSFGERYRANRCPRSYVSLAAKQGRNSP